MEARLRRLTEQVKTYLASQQLADPDGPAVYRDFYDQCRQEEVTEEEFFKTVLKTAVRELRLEENVPDPDPPNPKGLTVELFGERFRSLKRLGQVLFDHPENALHYLEDVTLLKAHVNELSSGDQALALTRLYQGEPDPRLRLFRIVYALNPALGYRIGGSTFSGPEALVETAFRDYPLFTDLHEHYHDGRLSIWLAALDPDRFPAEEKRDALGFLRLVYRCGTSLPVYIETRCFQTPADIVREADEQPRLRERLYTFAEKGYLFLWADSRGWAHWRPAYKNAVKKLKAAGLEGEELKAAALQELLLVLDVTRAKPRLTVLPAEVRALTIPASAPFTATLSLQLEEGASASARLALEGGLPGVRVETDHLVFNRWEHRTAATLQLHADPLQLVKGKTYQGRLVISTQEETSWVPLELRAVFPVRDYLAGLAKYAALGALFTGLCRMSLSLFSGSREWLPAGWSGTDPQKELPTHAWPAFFTLLLVLAALAASLHFVRRTAKN